LRDMERKELSEDLAIIGLLMVERIALAIANILLMATELTRQSPKAGEWSHVLENFFKEPELNTHQKAD